MSLFSKITGRVGDILDEVSIPPDANRAFDEAISLMDKGDTGRAVSILNGIAERYPQVQRTFTLIARAQQADHHWLAAWEAYDRALALKESAELHLRAGECLEKMGRLKDAEKHFRKGSTCKDYTNLEYELSFALGRVYAGLGRDDKAERELKRAHRQRPDSWEVGSALVRVVGRRDPKAGLELWNRLESVANSGEKAVLHGWLLESLGDSTKALEAFKNALEHTESVEALIGVGRIELGLGNAAKALEYLQRAEPETKEMRVSWLRLKGQTAIELGDDSLAADSFGKALEIAPDDAASLIGLGQVDMRRDAFDIAGGHFQRALSDREFRPLALVWMGIWHARKDDLGTARHFLEEAYRESSDDAVRSQALTEMGMLSKVQGDFAEATVLFQEAMTLDPRRRESLKSERESCFESLRYDWKSPMRPDDPLGLAHLIEEMSAWLSSDTRLGRFSPRVQALARQLDSPLSLAIVGEFNAGKSTLLNALLGEDLLPMGVLPTTAHLGIVRFGPRRAARVFFAGEDGESSKAREVDFDEASRLMRENAEEIGHIEFVFPHPSLRAVEYWDTPGFNAIEERHEAVAQRALDQAEAILWVMDANQVLSQTEFELIDRIKDGNERIVVVINKVDRLSKPGDITELVDYVEEHVGAEIAGVFPLSAIQARAGESSEFASFKTFLDQKIVDRAGRIKVLEVGKHVQEVFDEIRVFANERLETIASAQAVIDESNAWLTKAHAALRPELEKEERGLQDRVDFMVSVFEKEVGETLRPSGQLITRLSLAEEDAEFLASLMVERIGSVVSPSESRAIELFGDLETALAQRLESVFRGLELQESRVLQRRADGYFDESRQARQLLEERLGGRIRAEALGRTLAGKDVLMSLEDQDRSHWRARLRGLIPDAPLIFRAQTDTWGLVWLERTRHFLARLRGELELMEQETRFALNVPEELPD